MHINEPLDLWERYIAPEFKDRAPHCVYRDRGLDFNTQIPGGKTRTPPADQDSISKMRDVVNVQYDHAIARDFDSVSQIDAMNNEGVDIAVLYPSRGLGVLAHDEVDPPLALAISRAYNDWLYEFCQHDPKRLKGAAMIPLHDIDDAVLEARRAVTELGMVAFFPGTCPQWDLNWHEPFFDPLWAEVERLDVTWGIHEPINRQQNVGGRFAPYIMSHIVRRPIENMMSCTSIIVGGVLERFPGLKVALLEGNCSWAPFLLERMDEHVERLAKGDDPYATALTMKPSEYFKRQCTVTMESDEETVRHVIDALGDDCITFTTDFPHSDAKYPHATELILETPGLTDTNKRKILWDNSIRIYGLSEAD
jgi:predicted TIM-barrel fold metal-dependent hydrolase